jgi:hypothetical protein
LRAAHAHHYTGHPAKGADYSTPKLLREATATVSEKEFGG